MRSTPCTCIMTLICMLAFVCHGIFYSICIDISIYEYLKCALWFSVSVSLSNFLFLCKRLLSCMCLQVNMVVPITVYCVGAEWSAQWGNWIVCRQPAAATSASDQHYTYRAEYWSTHPNCAAAKWPRKSCQAGRMRPGSILQRLTQTWRTCEALLCLSDR